MCVCVWSMGFLKSCPMWRDFWEKVVEIFANFSWDFLEMSISRKCCKNLNKLFSKIPHLCLAWWTRRWQRSTRTTSHSSSLWSEQWWMRSPGWWELVPYRGVVKLMVNPRNVGEILETLFQHDFTLFVLLFFAILIVQQYHWVVGWSLQSHFFHFLTFIHINITNISRKRNDRYKRFKFSEMTAKKKEVGWLTATAREERVALASVSLA